jgi:hypothetical protein
MGIQGASERSFARPDKHPFDVVGVEGAPYLHPECSIFEAIDGRRVGSQHLARLRGYVVENLV